MCSGLDAISSDGVSTGTGFRLVANYVFVYVQADTLKVNEDTLEC